MMTAPLPPSASQPGFQVDLVLECARGIAALWVFMFHIEPMFAPWPLLATLARHGHQGVPLFFVISGYCMMAAAANTLAAQRAPMHFLRRRLLRIFPPFWLSVLAVMAAPYAIEAVSALKSGQMASIAPAWLGFGWSDWLQLLTLTRVFGAPGGDLQAAFSPINAVYWSLAIEVQFYLVMWAALYARARWQQVLVAVTLGALLANLSPALLASGLFMKYWPAFAIGALLREGHRRGWTPAALFGARELPAALLASGVLLAVLLGLIYGPACAVALSCTTLPSLAFTLASLLAASLLWSAGGIEHALRSGAPRLPWLKAWMLLPLVWLGQSSYSLYLLHGKIYQLPLMVVRQLVPATSLLTPLLTVGGTALLCYGFYLLAEKPFHQLAKRAGQPKAGTPAPVAALP
jgi:peptidoglycan/LPS O-acetylase OafA/YrhL